MHCPHCNYSISLFSKTLNRFNKQPTCPNCREPIELAVDSIRMLALLPIVVVLYITILGPLFAVYDTSAGLIIFGIMVVIAISFSVTLKPLKKSQ